MPKAIPAICSATSAPGDSGILPRRPRSQDSPCVSTLTRYWVRAHIPETTHVQSSLVSAGVRGGGPAGRTVCVHQYRVRHILPIYIGLSLLAAASTVRMLKQGSKREGGDGFLLCSPVKNPSPPSRLLPCFSM